MLVTVRHFLEEGIFMKNDYRTEVFHEKKLLVSKLFKPIHCVDIRIGALTF